MQSALPILLIGAMLATLAVVVIGVVAFGVNGRFYKKNANRLMRLRVLLQGLALAVLGLIAVLAAAG